MLGYVRSSEKSSFVFVSISQEFFKTHYERKENILMLVVAN